MGGKGYIEGTVMGVILDGEGGCGWRGGVLLLLGTVVMEVEVDNIKDSRIKMAVDRLLPTTLSSP